MDQRISPVTLGVRTSDVPATSPPRSAGGDELPDGDVVFFQAAGIVVALRDRARLAADSGVPDAGGWGGVTSAPNVAGPAEVDVAIPAARAAGATIARGPAPTVWGRLLRGVRRPDGHPWEVAHNPHCAAWTRRGRTLLR